MEWSAIVSPATILAIILAGVGFGGWVFHLGGKNNELDVMRADLVRLKSRREDEREADRKERDGFQIAVNAGLEMARSNLSEFQKVAAERFATKNEMAALEDRTNKGMDRIVDRLEQISGRLETIGDTINKTLATLVTQGLQR